MSIQSFKSYMKTPVALTAMLAISGYAFGWVFGRQTTILPQEPVLPEPASSTMDEEWVVIEPTTHEVEHISLSLREKILRVTDNVFPKYLKQEFVFTREELQIIPVISTLRTANFNLFQSLFNPTHIASENWHEKLVEKYQSQNNPAVALQVAAVMRQLSMPLSEFARRPETDFEELQNVVVIPNEVGNIKFFCRQRDEDLVFSIEGDSIELKDIATYNSKRHVIIHYPHDTDKVHCTVITKYMRQ